MLIARVLFVASGLIGLALIAFGFYALFAIGSVADMTALVPRGVAGVNEARAVYAGSFWAMGGLILYALACMPVRSPVLFAVGVIFLGFVAARCVSILMDGFDPSLAPAIISEIIVVLILLMTSRSPAAAR